MYTETKLFEIRDRATFIPVIATRIEVGAGRQAEDWLARRGGWAPHSSAVYLYRVDGRGKGYYEPFDWNDRTMRTAHEYIAEHWRKLDGGAVVDVEWILDETQKPKTSERDDQEEQDEGDERTPSIR